MKSETRDCQNCPVKSRAFVSRFYEDPPQADKNL